LRDWCRLILREAADYGTIGAACYPHLCAMHADFSHAWTRIRAIDVASDFAEAVQNLKERSRKEQGWLAVTDETCEKVQAFLHEGKDEWRRRCDVLTVDPARLDEDREGVAADLHAFLTRDGGSTGASGA
jgi:hypothetical protein